MKQTDKHIIPSHSGSILSRMLLLLMLCLTACSSGDDIQTPTEKPDNQPTLLYVYVHTPQTEVPTRAYVGDIDPIGHEADIYLLQIWVFTHDSHQLISYFSSSESSALSTGDGYEVLQLTVDETYAETAEASRENVDVYVTANVSAANCNLTLDHQTSQATLEEALIEKTEADPFGLTAPVTVVPTDAGLPMSGVLRNQPVAGAAPVLRLDNSGEIATVTLVRTLSKIRFAFSRQTSGEELQITSIKLNSGMIPLAQYLFMSDDAPYDRQTCHIKTASGYETSTPELLDETIGEVAANADPVAYAWGNEELEPQAYEQLLDEAAANGNITQRTFFLRESDQMLQGEIKYRVGNGDEQTSTFRMTDDGGFSRNHIWTVYAYLAQAKLQVVAATVAPWKQVEEDYEFYNW
ncbi:MAG: hypothetical protein IJP70_08690 [Bacteroidales bacterium]|nr:hypothetical protein [Bacteroidales bacterium]